MGAWVNTEYNTDGIIKYGDIDGLKDVFYYFSTDNENCYITLNGNPIKKEDVIISGKNYLAKVANEI